jgi:malate dehydrogenase (oxaloacetate-decarboxylating)
MLKYSKRVDTFTGEEYIEVPFKGSFLAEHPIYNKGTAWPSNERFSLNLSGLIPAQISNLSIQKKRAYEAFSTKESNLEKYIYMQSLQDRNETLFYSLILDHLEEMLPIVYTPTVGQACQQFSRIYRRGRGLYVSANNIDHIDHILQNTSFKDISLIVVTDGERILGLGDQGSGGMGIPIGKISLYVAAAGLHPAYTLPVMLDVGTNNQALLDDPLYIGLREKRLTGDAYDDVVEKFVAAVRRTFPKALLQWEDFGKNNAFRVLDKYQERICSFNDDIQGTGSVAFAVVLSAMKLKKQNLRDQCFIFFGQGQAGLGIARQIYAGLRAEGLSDIEAKNKLYGIDINGLLVEGMQVSENQQFLLKEKSLLANWNVSSPDKITLLETIKNAKATVLVGVTGQSGAFDDSILKAMSENTNQPVIMPLSNPTAKAECIPADAFRITNGNCIVATGSPFAPINLNGKEIVISQCNNLYIFPGVGLGALVCGTPRVTNNMFIAASKALASMVSEEDLLLRRLLPPIENIRQVSEKVALAVAIEARDSGLGIIEPDKKLRDMIKTAMWQPDYVPYRYVVE